MNFGTVSLAVEGVGPFPAAIYIVALFHFELDRFLTKPSELDVGDAVQGGPEDEHPDSQDIHGCPHLNGVRLGNHISDI